MSWSIYTEEALESSSSVRQKRSNRAHYEKVAMFDNLYLQWNSSLIGRAIQKRKLVSGNPSLASYRETVNEIHKVKKKLASGSQKWVGWVTAIFSGWPRHQHDSI